MDSVVTPVLDALHGPSSSTLADQVVGQLMPLIDEHQQLLLEGRVARAELGDDLGLCRSRACGAYGETGEKRRGHGACRRCEPSRHALELAFECRDLLLDGHESLLHLPAALPRDGRDAGRDLTAPVGGAVASRCATRVVVVARCRHPRTALALEELPVSRVLLEGAVANLPHARDEALEEAP